MTSASEPTWRDLLWHAANRARDDGIDEAAFLRLAAWDADVVFRDEPMMECDEMAQKEESHDD